MTAHSHELLPSSAKEQPAASAPSDGAEQVVNDIQAVNEQLLLAALREQALADELRHQLAFTAAITASLAEGMLVLDTAGQCTFANPAAEQMLGWRSTELHGQHISAVFPANAVPTPLLGVLRFDTTHRDDAALFVHHDGGMFPTAYAVAPIITNGQIVGAVLTFRDMTDMRRLERTREEYLSLISHDLRTPLTAILGRAQMLVRWLTLHGFAREAASAKIVIESSLRMDDMLERLLDRTRTDADMDARQRSVIDLVAVVQQMLDQTLGPDEHARVTLDAVATLPIAVEVAQIERVIVNVLMNALKFSASDTPIIVRVYRQAADAIVAITDHGIGIASDDLPHLFEKHYRAQTAGQIVGHGLGLYNCRLIMEAQGGRIWAESTVGTGSTFTIALPLG